MHAKVEERKNDLRNTTVLEVILAVIIILLCVVYTKQIEIKTLEKNHAQQILDLQSENAKLYAEVRNLKRENNKLKDEIKRLERKIKRYKPKSPGEASALEKAEQEIKTLQEKLDKLNNQLDPSQREGKGGVDKPSCLIENGKIGYFANIVKKGNEFKFSLTGSTTNKIKVMTVPGARELFAKGQITLSELQQFGKLAFDHGRETSTPCVYFVKLDPNNWSGGEIKKLERYFYKSYR